MSLSGAVKGNAYRLEDVAQQDILPMEGQLAGMGMPALQSLSQYYNQITSSDPAMRTKAAAPVIAQDTAQSNQALNRIATMPRGGEQNALRADVVQKQAGDVGNTLNKLFTEGQTAKGELGQKEIADALTSISTYGDLDSAAAQIEMGQEKLDAANSSSLLGALEQAGQMAAEAAMAA
jgi:hypothetical protein